MTYVYHDHAEETPGLTAEEAAIALLTYDGNEFDIRPDPRGGWRLFTTARRDGPMGESVVFSVLDNEAAGRQDIFETVIAFGHSDRDEVYVTGTSR